MNKFIITHKSGETEFCNGFIIASHANHSLAAFSKLVSEARKSFEISDEEVSCHSVNRSGWCQGHSIIRFPLPVGSRAEGWTEGEKLIDVQF